MTAAMIMIFILLLYIAYRIAKLFVKLMLVVVVVVAVLVLALCCSNNPLPTPSIMADTTSTTEKPMTIGDSVYSYLKELNVAHPDLVQAKFILETGHFTSNKFRTANNPSGMMVPRNRPTTAVGEYNGSARYRTWREGVIDYALYQSSYMRGLSESQYYERMTSYSTNPYYGEHVRRIQRQVEARHGY